MPVTPTYPGVYVQETPSESHVINGLPTANTAFVDVFERGPLNRPVGITNFGEFTTTFGAIIPESKASYGIRQFFENGGATAFVVRVASKTASPSASATTKTPAIVVEAVGPGEWGNHLDVATQVSQNLEMPPGTFDLVVREVDRGTSGKAVVDSEVHMSLSTDPEASNYVGTVLEHQSQLIKLPLDSEQVPFTTAPAKMKDQSTSILNGANITDPNSSLYTPLDGGKNDNYGIDGGDLGVEAENGKPPQGYQALTEIAPNVFNLLCLPFVSTLQASEWTSVYTDAYRFCEDQKAFLLCDYPTSAVDDDASAQAATTAIQSWFGDGVSNATNHAAVFFPRITIPDPNPPEGRPMKTENSGTMAGIFARTDAAHGVWKAPAGEQATLANVLEPTVKLNDELNGELNPLGINCIRTFPVIGTVSWGARTCDGADLLQSDWKYVPVRRTALFIEQSLQQGTMWAVFHPNDETLWSALRLSVGEFMDTLFKQGAFPATTPKDAYFVKCDATTTSPSDVANGIVNVIVGFAPQYPAEFIVLTITQEVQPS